MIVSRLPTVIASLANADAVTAAPPTRLGSLDTDWNGAPALSTNLTPVGMTLSASCSPRSTCTPTFHW